jgi:hypothetical protein
VEAAKKAFVDGSRGSRSSRGSRGSQGSRGSSGSSGGIGRGGGGGKGRGGGRGKGGGRGCGSGGGSSSRNIAVVAMAVGKWSEVREENMNNWGSFGNSLAEKNNVFSICVFVQVPK